jgi:hypothetical protein
MFSVLFIIFSALPAHALEMQVSTGIYYYPSAPEKLDRAQTESAEEGLEFHTPREPRDMAKEFAGDELRNGNVCLRQLRSGLKESVKKWRVRDLCNTIFQDSISSALRDAAHDKLHPDHVECRAEAEAREEGDSIKIWLAFRAQLVMSERVPPKLRNVGIGGDFVRRDLPETTDVLGTAAGSWKEALKAGACNADVKALDGFWAKLESRAAEFREVAECRNGFAAQVASIEKMQKQLKEYVPDEWVHDSAGKDYSVAMGAVSEMDESATMAECVRARENTEVQFEKLRSVSTKIAEKYEIPALDPMRSSSQRAPASVDSAGESDSEE